MLSSTSAPSLDFQRGFLPLQDPLTRLPQPFDAWETVASGLPKLLVSDHILCTIQELPPFPLDRITNGRERERAMTLLSYLGYAYVWGGAEARRKFCPRGSPFPGMALRIAWDVRRCSATVAMRCTIITASIRTARSNAGNIALIQNFLGGLDEEWFILIHVDIERKAAPGLAALHPSLDAAEKKDAAQLEYHLEAVHHSIEAMYAALKRMTEWCDPYIYYHRVRPYIHGWKNHPDLPHGLIYQGVDAYGGQPQQFRGETGAQSAIVPSLDAMLGIGHKEDVLRTT